MNDLDYLISQLNLLVGFLDVSDKQIYEQIKTHDRFNIGITIEQLYDYSYANYSSHITNSALLLGFTHLEDFISKAIANMLTSRPELNEYKTTFKTISEKGDKLKEFLAAEQTRKMTFSEKLKFVEKHIEGIAPQIITEIKFVTEIRNCLMHNNGLADQRLLPKYQVGQKIIFTSGDVHSYGLQARQLARQIWGGL